MNRAQFSSTNSNAMFSGCVLSWLGRCAACLKVSALDYASGVNDSRSLSPRSPSRRRSSCRSSKGWSGMTCRGGRPAFSAAPSFAPTLTPSRLEPDVVVREFLELYPDPVEVVAAGPAIAFGGRRGRGDVGPPTRLRCLVGSAVGSLSRLPAGEVRRSPVCRRRSCGRRSAVSVRARRRRSSEPDLVGGGASLCVELGRLDETREAAPLLQEAARILDAVGLIVWVWHPQAVRTEARRWRMGIPTRCSRSCRGSGAMPTTPRRRRFDRRRRAWSTAAI